jgi:hypothetical protein
VVLIQRRVLLGELDYRDTEGPDVDFEVIHTPGKSFGCHPLRGTDEGVAFICLICKLGTDSKVAELDTAVGVDEDVGG